MSIVKRRIVFIITDECYLKMSKHNIHRLISLRILIIMEEKYRYLLTREPYIARVFQDLFHKEF